MRDELREFFYVDVDRVRSLLAQLQGGVVEAIKAETTSAVEGGAQAAVFGIGGHGGYTRESRSEESRSLQDLTFVAFEETANETGLITELDEQFRDPEAWAAGGPHASLREGQLIRIECDVQVLDGGLFGDRVQRFNLMGDAMVELTGEQPSAGNNKQRAQQVARAKEELMGISSSQLSAVSKFVQAFVGDSVSLRVLPCGREHLEYGFSGAMLGREEYIQQERENLFSRYGNLASRWTSVMQVAAIPSDPTTLATDELLPDTLQPGGDFSRAAMERLAGDLLAMMESIGIVEGPRWPSISVTPLGLYRTVPGSPGPTTRAGVRVISAAEYDSAEHLDDESTLVLDGHWTYQGSGWLTTADAALANASAAAARERQPAAVRSRVHIRHSAG